MLSQAMYSVRVCVCVSKQANTQRKHNTLAGIKNGVLTSETCWSPYDDVASSHCHLLIPLTPPPSSFYLLLLPRTELLMCQVYI